jgi:hypothetical protein
MDDSGSVGSSIYSPDSHVCWWLYTGDDLRLSRYSRKPNIMADDTQKQDVIRLEERTLQQDIIAEYEGEKSKKVLRKVCST